MLDCQEYVSCVIRECTPTLARGCIPVAPVRNVCPNLDGKILVAEDIPLFIRWQLLWKARYNLKDL